jgi:hypothetical protein
VGLLDEAGGVDLIVEDDDRAYAAHRLADRDPYRGEQVRRTFGAWERRVAHRTRHHHRRVPFYQQVLRNTYGFTGSETDLLERGLISASMFDGPKARIFLSLLLRSGASKEEIAEAFDRPFGG